MKVSLPTQTNKTHKTKNNKQNNPPPPVWITSVKQLYSRGWQLQWDSSDEPLQYLLQITLTVPPANSIYHGLVQWDRKHHWGRMERMERECCPTTANFFLIYIWNQAFARNLTILSTQSFSTTKIQKAHFQRITTKSNVGKEIYIYIVKVSCTAELWWKRCTQTEAPWKTHDKNMWGRTLGWNCMKVLTMQQHCKASEINVGLFPTLYMVFISNKSLHFCLTTTLQRNWSIKRILIN